MASKFYDRSLIDIVVSRGQEQAKLLVSSEMHLWMLLVVLLLFVLSYHLRDCRAGLAKINKELPSVFVGIGMVYGLIAFRILPDAYVVPVAKYIFILLLVGVSFYVLCLEMLHQKNGILFAWGCSMFVYTISGFAAPFGGGRTLLPLYFYLISFAIYLTSRYSVRIPKSILIVILATALNNYAFTTKGYMKNYPIHLVNAQTMKESAVRIQNGAQIKEITLQKFDTKFAENNPWGKTQYETIWMKFYYDLPQNVEIKFAPKKNAKKKPT